MYKYILLFFALIIFSSDLKSQEYNFGVRAGQNYSTIRGPKEAGEDFGYSGGFHFGINFYYNFTDNFSLRTELMYIQNGYDWNFEGDSYYLIRKNSGVKFEKGTAERNVIVSNAYLTIPVTAHLRLSRKWVVFGGAYLNMLIGPTGRGTLAFTSTDNPEDIFFRQSLDFRYYSDDLAEFVTAGTLPPLIFVEGEEVLIPKVVGAYYQYYEKKGSNYNFFDLGLSAGVSYYFNRGFYLSLKADYGFMDITNNEMDRSLVEQNEDNSYIYRSDSDKHLGFQVSFGFKF